MRYAGLDNRTMLCIRTKRSVRLVLFGFALYKGKFKDGKYKGRHVGLLDNFKRASAWMRGKKVKGIILVAWKLKEK